MLRLQESDEIQRLVMRALVRNGVGISRILEPHVRDPTSQLIIEALVTRGACNLSQLAEYVRDAKGSSSRTTVRKRIQGLQTRGVVTRSDKGANVALTETFFRDCWDRIRAIQSAEARRESTEVERRGKVAWSLPLLSLVIATLISLPTVGAA